MSFLELALLGQILFWLLIVLLFVISGQASLYHPLTMYLGFHAIVFVVRPLLVRGLGFDAMWNYIGFEPSDADFLRSLEVSSVALLVFALASFVCGKCQMTFPQVQPRAFTREQLIGLVLTTGLLLPIIARSILASFSGEATGERVGGVYIMTGASGYTVEAQYMIGPLMCAWLAVTRFRWQAMLGVVFFILYRSYSGWSRWTILLFFVSAVLIYSWQKRLKWPPLAFVLCAAPVLMLFNLLGHNRAYLQQMLRGEGTSYVSPEAGISQSDLLRTKYDGPDFANFDFLTFVTAVVPERTGTFTYGSQYLQLFTEPVPRKLWAGKPIGAPVVFFSLNSYGNFNGMTVTLPGDGWMSGGWIGIIITMSTVGAFLGLAHRWFWKHVASNAASLIYLVGLAMLPQWFRDGGISISKFLLWNLLPLLLWFGIAWLLGARWVPVYSILLPRGARVRFIPAANKSKSS